MTKHINTVTSGLPGTWLARFAIEWANNIQDPAGKRVTTWVENTLDHQAENSDANDVWVNWSPRTFDKGGQERVRRWLAAVHTARAGSQAKGVLVELEEQVEAVVPKLLVHWSEDHGPIIVTTVSGSAESLAAVGVVALASPELNVGFGRCRWEKCGRFFLEAGVRRGKKGRGYCPDRSCGVSARVHRHRHPPKASKR